MLTLRCLFPLTVFPPLSFGSVQSRVARRNPESPAQLRLPWERQPLRGVAVATWLGALGASRLRSAARYPPPPSAPSPPSSRQVAPRRPELGETTDLLRSVPSPLFICFSFIEKEIYTQRG